MPPITTPLPELALIVTDADGVMRVGRTRVTLDTVVGAYADGATPETIAEQYPSLTLADVYAAIGYYLRHQADVDRYLAERGGHAATVRQATERQTSPAGLRRRLLARREMKN